MVKATNAGLSALILLMLANPVAAKQPDYGVCIRYVMATTEEVYNETVTELISRSISHDDCLKMLKKKAQQELTNTPQRKMDKASGTQQAKDLQRHRDFWQQVLTVVMEIEAAQTED